jgi:hypothetical protein
LRGSAGDAAPNQPAVDTPAVDTPAVDLKTDCQPGRRRDYRRRSRVDGVDDLRAIDPLQVDRRDPEMRMPEPALDDDQRHTLARHLNGVSVTELMRHEPSSDTGVCRDARQLLARTGLLSPATSSRAADHPQQRTDRQLTPDHQPPVQLRPCPAVHPDLATTPTLTATHQHSSTRYVKVGLGKIEHFTDPNTRAPQDHDQRPQADTIRPVASSAHHSDDLLHGGPVRRIALPFVPQNTTS